MASNPDSSYRDSFSDRRVLVTGGLGFIGSNLILELVERGASITVLDCFLEGHGANPFNVETVAGEIRVVKGDVRDERLVGDLVKQVDYVFHLAGQNDHLVGIWDPHPDIDINVRGSLVLLEACRRHSPGARLVYTGTRGEYGPAATLPVNEEAPTNPKGLHELSKLTAQHLFRLYHDIHGMSSIGLRLTNIYGERAQMRHARFGVANIFVRRALDNEAIEVFGDGSTLRDFLYVGDAIQAIIAAAEVAEASGRVLNVGSNSPTTLLDFARAVVAEAGSGRYELVPYSPERAKLEPGDFYPDISKIQRLTGWYPSTSLALGIRHTVDYYRRHRKHYW